MNNAREVTFVVARARDGTIARDGQVPWRIREDLQRFVARPGDDESHVARLVHGRTVVTWPILRPSRASRLP